MTMSKIVAVANQKGGVGKTTTAVNLAAALVRFNKKVLLIDMDPQANATSGLGMDKRKVSPSMYQIIIGQNEISEAIVKLPDDSLDIAPSSIQLIGAEVELVGELAREFRLRNAIGPIRGQYDYIFIDCPPSLGLLTINSLVAADTVLIPLQCEYYALEGLGQLLHTLKLVQDNLNKNLSIEGVLLTMYDSRLNLATQVVEEIRKYFKEKTYSTMIPRNVRLSEAPSHGKSIFIYDKSSTGSRTYMELAKEFLGRNGQEPAA